MDRTATNAANQIFLCEIRSRLDKAHGIAKAAEACGETGQYEKALEIILEVEPLSHEVASLIEATCLVHRLSKK